MLCFATYNVAKVTARREAGRSVVTTKGVVDTSSSLTGDVHCMRDSDSSPARGEREALGGNEISRGGSETSSLEATVRHVCSQRYDVFLSYAEEDKEFAEEMRSRLVGQAKLRVFVPSDGNYRTTYVPPMVITLLRICSKVHSLTTRGYIIRCLLAALKLVVSDNYSLQT